MVGVAGLGYYGAIADGNGGEAEKHELAAHPTPVATATATAAAA